MWFLRFRRFVWRVSCIKRISCMLSCFMYGYPFAVEAAAGPLLGHSWASPGLASGGHWAAPGLLLGCPGASWAVLGLLLGSWTASGRPPACCSWRLLAAPGRSWLLLGAPWRLVAAPGGSWPLLSAPVRSWLRLPVRRRRGRGVAAISSPSWLLVPATARFLTQIYVHMHFLFVISYT